MDSIYPRNITFLDLSRNDTLNFAFLERLAKDRATRRKLPFLTIDIRDCDGITGEEIQILQCITTANIVYLSNPKLESNSPAGLRDYIHRLISL